jgi:folate-binding protein YgfZ
MNFAKGPFYCNFPPRAVLKVTGEDALTFLQGQFSQDLREGQTPEANYGLWLNEKGKVQGDSVVWRESPELCRVFSWSMSADELRERFDRYIIADDVELEDEAGAWQAWVVGEVGASEVEGLASEHLAWAFPSLRGLPWKVVVARESVVWPADWKAVDQAMLRRRLIEAGEPSVPVDVGREDLPQEGGLEKIGVSFRKGCYLGQEVMARLDALGRVRRTLVQVRGEGAVPAEGVESILRQGDRKIGLLRSRVSLDNERWVGLAMVSLAAWRADSEESLVLSVGPDQTRPIEILEVKGRE